MSVLEMFWCSAFFLTAYVLLDFIHICLFFDVACSSFVSFLQVDCMQNSYIESVMLHTEIAVKKQSFMCYWVVMNWKATFWVRLGHSLWGKSAFKLSFILSAKYQCLDRAVHFALFDSGRPLFSFLLCDDASPKKSKAGHYNTSRNSNKNRILNYSLGTVKPGRFLLISWQPFVFSNNNLVQVANCVSDEGR